MPAIPSTFGYMGANKEQEVIIQKVVGWGLPTLQEGGFNFKLGDVCRGISISGNPNARDYAVADASPGQAANIVLLPDFMVPNGLRVYLLGVVAQVMGEVNWGVTSPTAGAIPFLSLQDSMGVPLIHLPFSALRGGAKLVFPEPELASPMLLGPNTVNAAFGTPVTTFTYNATTGVVTAGAASFVANVGVGGTARVVDGTGAGQAAIVTAVGSTTALTVSPPFVGLDATSVLAIDYQTIKTATSTTSSTLYNSTNYTASAFLNQAEFIMGINGTGSGQIRQISASTTAGALTYPTALTTNFDTTSTLVYVTNNPSNGGAIDTACGKTATATPGKGLQLVVNGQAGTSPVGSNVRITAEFIFAA